MADKNFHITINGLVYDKEGKLLLLKEIYNTWDIPGGRLEHGETFQDCFKRECEEEMGVKGRLIEDKPSFMWTAQDVKERWRLILCFKAELDSLNFKQSDECIDHAFLNKEELIKIDLRPQTKQILDFI